MMTRPHGTRILDILLYATILSLSSALPAEAQLTKLDQPGQISQADIYIDSRGVEYSTLINVQFSGRAITPPSGAAIAQLKDVDSDHSELRLVLQQLEREFGTFSLKKVHPWAVWGQRTYSSPRNGKTVMLPELSQKYTLIFDRLVPVGSVIQRLAETPSVRTATGPQIGYSTYTPNDWSYDKFQSTADADSGQWGLSKIASEKAWDLTRGSDDILVAISEPWKTSSCIDYPHVDLYGKIDNSAVNDCYEDSGYGWHAGAVAGVVGAITDNGNWAASLGWNVQLVGVPVFDGGIMEAVYAGADIINCSWRTLYTGAYTSSLDELNIAIHTALENGIVVVAGNGNGPNPSLGFSPPAITYPSGFDYTSAQTLAYHDTTLTTLGNAQVIAVTASDSVDKYLDYCPGGIPDDCPYNYSPGTSPTTNPSSAFMDVAAPGIRVWILYHKTGDTNNMVTRSGTSFAAPLVSALAALMLSVNEDLEPTDVHEILARTSEKVIQSPYGYNYTGLYGQSWGPRFGYGRINAYEALKYTLENYGGTIGGSGETVTIHETIEIKSGATLTIASGTTVEFDPGVHLDISGTLIASNVTFTAASTTWNGILFKSGSSGSILNSTIEDVGCCLDAINIDDASPTIRYNDISSAGYGIWVEGGSAIPIIRNNTITTGLSGIIFYGGGGYVQYNTITGNDSGSAIAASIYGDPILGQEDIGPGNNIITDYDYGLNALSGSSIWSQGYDCVSDLDFQHLRAISSSDVTAIQDWWGGGDPSVYTASGGTVDWYPKYNGSCPASGASKGPLPIPDSDIAADDLPTRLLKARVLRQRGRTSEAVIEYKRIIDDAPLSAQAGSAFLDLGRLARRTRDSGLAEYLESSAEGDSKYRLHILGVLVGYYLDSGDAAKALEIAEFVETEGIDTWHAFGAGWQVYRMHMAAGRFDDAAEAFSGMNPLNEFDEALVAHMANELSEEAPEEYARCIAEGPDGTGSGGTRLEATAYPNPFNPITTITFRLAAEAKASVRVFDVLGRLVARVATGEYAVGTHQVVWDASGVASGLYFAVITDGHRMAHVPLLVAK